MAKRKTKEKKPPEKLPRPETIMVVDIGGTKVQPVMEIDGHTFYQMKADEWLTTGRWMGALPWLKARELFNMDPTSFQAYEDELTDRLEEIFDQVNEALMAGSTKVRASKFKIIQTKVSDLALLRATFRHSLTLLDMPEVAYRVAVHALFLEGDNPAEALSHAEQDRRIEILKKKNPAFILYLPIIQELFELGDFLAKLSPDALEMRLKMDELIRAKMFGFLTDKQDPKTNTSGSEPGSKSTSKKSTTSKD